MRAIVDLPPEAMDELVRLVAERLLVDRPVGNEGWLRGAEKIAAYIDCGRDRVYALAACSPPRIPVHHDGSALVARKTDLDAWLGKGGGKRP